MSDNIFDALHRAMNRLNIEELNRTLDEVLRDEKTSQ